MPKNFFHRLKESITYSNNNADISDMSHDFERTKDVLFSSKTSEQLTSAVKYINNFNEKYKITEKSPEFTYFERMINIMKIKLRSKRFDVAGDLDESEQIKRWLLTSNIRLRNIIKEALGDLSWIEDTKSTFNPNFDFNGKEYWLDVGNLSSRERKQISDYIEKVLPNYKEFHSGGMLEIEQDFNKGIIIHCGSENTNYKPEENLLCFARQTYEDDFSDPSLNQNDSIYVDGKEVLAYIQLINDDEELDESLEWMDKDTSFDEKDKSFETDPTWTDDEYWTTNPERSYWKQGDAGGSGGGDMNETEDFNWVRDVEPDILTASKDVFFRDDSDMYMTLDGLGYDVTNMTEMTMIELAINYGYRWSDKHDGWYNRDEVIDPIELKESNDMDWIKDVSDQVPPMSSRKIIDLKDFIIELVKDSNKHMEVLEMLLNLDLFTPSEKYIYETGNNGEGFTPEEYDDFGVTNWLEGAWLEDGNSVWSNEPSLAYGEINELLNQANGEHKWVLEDWHTKDYNLEYGSYQDRYIFKNKIDGSYFALNFDGDNFDGITDSYDSLYQVFPKNVTKIIYESKLIKRVIKEEVEDIDVAYEDDNLVVIHPKTREASCQYGNDTQWCTSTDGGKSFDEYNSSGNLYYYIWKFKMPPPLQNFQKIARFVSYGKEYGEIGKFFLFNDDTIIPYDIIFNILQGKKDGNGFTYPNKLKPLNESWEKALIAVDTHYAKNGLHKTSLEYHHDEDNYGEDIY